MPTAGSIITNIKRLAGDPDGDWLTDAIGLDFLDRSQRRFCHKVLPLDEFQDFTITAKQPRFTVATDVITPINLMWYKSRVIKLAYTPPDMWSRVEEANPTSTGTPELYTFLRRQIVVGPQVPSTASGAVLASGAITAATVQITMASVSNLRTKGYFKINSEVVEYTAQSGTILTGCVRGVHGTTAASHASGDTGTQIDLIMLYRKTPPVMTATTSSPEIPAAFHDYLERYALYLYWLARGDSDKAAAAMNEFQDMEADAIKTIGRRVQDGLIHIQEKRNRLRWW